MMECVSTPQYNIELNGGVYRSIVWKRGLRLGDPISLLLVVILKYFTSIKRLVASQKGFKYHAKCKILQSNHICFADDMLIFSEGEYQAIMMMLRGWMSFSEASSTTTNVKKLNIFSTNMDKQELEDLCYVIRYENVKQPFMYLGVSVSAKRLSTGDCKIFVDKMTTV